MSRCCATSIGILITDADQRLMMIERGWYPHGIAPVAGHIADQHACAADAAAAEVGEEIGMRLTSHTTIIDGLWLPNLCQSLPAALPGHRWTVATATVEGALLPDPQEFTARPGMEPVWLELLHIARRLPIPLSTHDRALLQRVYTTPPRRYWDGQAAREVPAEICAARLAEAHT